jgi:hypothetical protein
MMTVRTTDLLRARLIGGLVLLFLLSVPGLASGAAAAEHRLALVIGNARYPDAPLSNPEHDARLIANTLSRLGFEVTERENLSIMEFRRVLREYVRRLQDEDGAAVFFYAGHGVQIAGRNYLLPVDINLHDEDEVRDDAVDIDEQLVRRIESGRTRVRIVILDACRDDPYASSGARRGLTRATGLAEMSASGALIAYSSAPGQESEDGPPGTNSVYTRNLAKEMLAEGIEVEKMFKNVLVDVLRDTHAQQVPWVNSSLTADFSFNPTRVEVADAASVRNETRSLPKQADTAFVEPPAHTAVRLDATPGDKSSPVLARRVDQPPSTASEQADGPPPFAEAVKAVVSKVLERVNLDSAPTSAPTASRGVRPAPLVVDSLIDASTGFRTRATKAIEQEFASAAHARLPRLELTDFSDENLARRPLVLIGTVTPVEPEGRTDGARSIYAIRLALIDLERGVVVSNASARSRVEGIDATPTRFYGEMPAWAPEPSIEAYTRACNDAIEGAPIDPAYRDGLEVSALVSTAIEAYEAGRFREAFDAFVRARRQAAAPQLRIESGLYLAANRLDRVGDAQQAFARIVDLGLARGRLGVRFLFRPDATQFLDDTSTKSGYGLWLGLVAQRAEIRRGCLQIAGNTTRRRDKSASAKLSLGRALAVKDRIDEIDPQIASRTLAVGRGFEENLSGLGTGDGRDAIDQRVEFKVLDCHHS